MRQLRFVKPGDDGNHVILETADGNEQFLLLIDVPMRDAVRSDLPRLTPTHPEPEAAIGPREIQMRVRAGESPQTLAEDNAMSLEKVLRFAGPVLEERARIADEARRARARRSTTEGQTVIFGEAVDARFAAHGLDPAAVRWDSRRREDGQWIVVAGWLGGDIDRTAEWLLNLGTRQVSPLDDTAADLLSDRPIRPVNPREPAVRPNLVSAPPLAPGVVAFPAMPHAHTGPIPVVEDVFDQDALDENPRHISERDFDPRPTPTGRSVAPKDDFHTPPLPLRLADEPLAPVTQGDPAEAEPATEQVAPHTKT
ncbi:MAG: septation protein SepH, partial [Jatrophihabitantaceae bacterium]